MDQNAESESEQLREAAAVAGMDVPEIVLPVDRVASVNGLSLHYLDWEGTGRQTALFLHGARLTAHTWDLVCLALRPRVHCLALDARGHGDSAWAPSGEYGRAAHVSDVAALVETLGLERFVLVGHSMGGSTAVAYASQHGERLEALVLVDAGPRVDVGREPSGTQRLHDFNSGPSELDSPEAFLERAIAFNPARDPRLLRRSLRHSLRQTPHGRWTWKYDREGLARRAPADGPAQRLAIREAAAGTACPTLIIRGGYSDLFSDEDAAYCVTVFPQGQWRKVENAGHNVQGDNPRGLVDALGPFLATLGA